MSIMIPSCNAHAYMKFSKKNFAPYAKNATVKNIITINKYNVGMKSLDRAIIVSDTLRQKRVQFLFLRFRFRFRFRFRLRFRIPDSGFSIRPYGGSNSGYAIKPKKPVKRQADTEKRWNISQVSLFYLFH